MSLEMLHANTLDAHLVLECYNNLSVDRCHVLQWRLGNCFAT